QGERAGPALGEPLGLWRPPADVAARGLRVVQVDDQRVGRRPALGGEDAANGELVVGVGAEAVDGLGGKGDQASASQYFDRALNVGAHPLRYMSRRSADDAPPGLRPPSSVPVEGV